MQLGRKTRALVLAASLGVLAGCTDDGTGVHADLTGTWVGALPNNGELRLILTHIGEEVAGPGIIRDELGTGSLNAFGTWARAELDLSLELAPRQLDPTPCPAGLTGKLSTPDRLQGRFTDCDTSVPITLTRDPN